MRRLMAAVAVACVLAVGVVRAESMVEILDGQNPQCTAVHVNVYTSSAMTTWVGDFWDDECGPHSVQLSWYFTSGQVAASHYAVADYYVNNYLYDQQVLPLS